MFMKTGCWNDLQVVKRASTKLMGNVSMKTLDSFSGARVAGVKRHAALNTPVGEIPIGWMEAAASYHDLCPDPYNYVFSIERAVVVDIPNRNSDGFIKSEVHKFNGNLSLPTWQTFERRPVYYEHNQVPRDARGLIFKAFIEVEGPYQLITCVTGVCKRKDASLAQAVKNKTRPFWSMGCLADSVRCSICNKVYTESNQFCTHLGNMLGTLLNGNLVYEILGGITYIELSNVNDPAALIAADGSFDIQDGKAVDLNKLKGYGW